MADLAASSLKALLKWRKKDNQEPAIEQLLRPIEQIQLDDGSDISEISDVFEDFHKNSYLKPQFAKMYLTKNQADIKTMEDFTMDYKKTMRTLKTELNIDNQLLAENEHDIIISQQNSPSDSNLLCTSALHGRIKETLDKMEQIPLDDEEKNDSNSTNSTSILWRMLTVNTDKEKFQISPPNYHAFRQPEPHWLERPPVSWDDMDKSKTKCEKWLENCQ